MPKQQPPPGLLWIGDGTRFIPGVPARDLSPDEVTDRTGLIASGLYTDAASESAVSEKADQRKETKR